MSLRMSRRLRAEASAIRARSRWRSGSGSSSISPRSPRTPVIGVRNLVAHGGEETRLGVGRRLRLAPPLVELLLPRDVVGDVPHQPHHPRHPLGVDVVAGDVANVPDLAVRPDDAIERDEPAMPRGRLAGRGERTRPVVGVDGADPVRLAEVALAIGKAEQRAGPLVPQQVVGREVDVPDADVRGRQRELQAPGQARQLGLALTDLDETGLTRRDEPPRRQDRQDDDEAREREDQPLPPGIRRRPSPLRHGGERPVPDRQRDLHPERIAVEDARVPEEDDRPEVTVVAADQRQVDGQVGREEPGVAEEHVAVERHVDQPPEPPRLPVPVDEDRRPDDEAALAGHEVHRPADHRRPEGPRHQGRAARPRRRELAAPEERLGGRGIDHGDDEVRRRGERPDALPPAHHPGRQPFEVLGRDVRLVLDDADHALDELDVAVERALQLRADDVERVGGVASLLLAMRRPALLLRHGGENHHRQGGDGGQEIGKPNDRAPCFDLRHVSPQTSAASRVLPVVVKAATFNQPPIAQVRSSVSR